MSIARHHAEWLSLVPVSGPFLSLPVLMDAFPQGLDAHNAEHARFPQFERNKNAMRARAQEISGETERETEAIKARFANPQARMFPEAVTFLVPEKLSVQ